MISELTILGILALIGYSLLINRIKGLPPGPSPLPFIGNLLQMQVDMDEKFVIWKKKYGRVFTVWIPHPTVVISDYKLLHEHIVKDGEKFSERSNSRMKMNYLIGGEHGLVFNYNTIWKEQRKFATHALRSSGYTGTVVQNAAIDYSMKIIERWKIQGANMNPIDPSLGIKIGVTNITWQQTFGRTLPFDDPLIEHVNELSTEYMFKTTHPIVAAQEFIPSLLYLDKFLGSPMKNLRDVTDQVVALIKKELEVINKDSNDNDQPGCYAESYMLLIKRRERSGESLGSFTEHQLVAACFDLLMAGFETTVITLRCAIYHMINRPDVQRKAQKEIDQHVGKRAIQMEDQKSLHYCNAIIQEVQRISNIVTVNFMRRVCSPVNIEGYEIQTGTGVLPEFNIVHHDEDEFERPLLFWPERHLNAKAEFVKDPRITPFSMGKRSCLGEPLARMELFIFFTSFLQHLTFSSVTKVPPTLSLHIGLTRCPAPFEVVVEGRG